MMRNDWRKSTVAELCDIVKGTAPIQKTAPGPYPLVTTGAERRTANDYQLDCEAVCVPMISSTGHGHASLKRVHYQTGKFALANLLTALLVRDKSQLSPRFLALYINYFKDRLLVPLMVGAANMSLTPDRLASVTVSFPPLAYQNRALSIMDDVEELRKLRAQADRRTADLIPALFYEMFGDPATNRKGWPISRFRDVCVCRLGKMLDAKRQTGAHPKPYLRNANVQWGRFNLTEVLEMDFDPKDQVTFRLRAGDLLICEGGEVGRAAIWSDELRECYFQKALHRARPDPAQAISQYLLYLLWSMARGQCLVDFTTEATIKHLTGVKLRSIPIMLPPLDLQRQFAARVAHIRALETRQAESRRRLDDLFQSLLYRAFRGEL